MLKNKLYLAILLLAILLAVGCEEEKDNILEMSMNADLQMTFPEGISFKMKPETTLVIPFSVHSQLENLEKATFTVVNKGTTTGDIQDWKTSVQYQTGDTAGTLTIVAPPVVKTTNTTFTLTVDNGAGKIRTYDFRVEIPLIVLSLDESGEVIVPVYRNTYLNGEYTFQVNKIGEEMPSLVKLKIWDDQKLADYNRSHNTDYMMLPSECIDFEKSALEFSETDEVLETNLTVKYKEFYALLDKNPGKQYVLPVDLDHPADSIENDKKSVILLASEILPQIQFREEEAVVEQSLSGCRIKLPMVVNIDNLWGGRVKVRRNDALLKEYNAAHGTSYSLLSGPSTILNDEIDLPEGTDKKELILEVAPENLTFGETYVLPLEITECQSDVYFKGEPCFLGIVYNLAPVTLTTDMLQNSVGVVREDKSLGYTDGGGLTALLDGSTSTYCHTDWKGVNGAYDPTYGHFLQFDLHAPTRDISFSFTGRNDRNNGNPILMELYTSDDAQNWSLLQKIDESANSAYYDAKEAHYSSTVFSANTGFTHFRFVVRKSKNGNVGNKGYFVLSTFSLNSGSYSAAPLDAAEEWNMFR